MDGRQKSLGHKAHRGEDADTQFEIDPDVDPESVAHTISLRLLTARARTRWELEQALARRRVPSEAVRHALDRLERSGLIDDEAYAAGYVAVRSGGRAVARRELARQLKTRGVDPDVAAAAVQSLDPEDERHAARSLVERRLSGMRSVGPEARRRRLNALLERRGYPSDLARAVVREVLGTGNAEFDSGEW